MARVYQVTFALMLSLICFCPLFVSGQILTAPVEGTSSITPLKIIHHNLSSCIVTRQNISGERKKYEVIYVEEGLQHHIYLSNRNAVRLFWKKPSFYLQRIKDIESEFSAAQLSVARQIPAEPIIR
jgi:hypothetical protein